MSTGLRRAGARIDYGLMNGASRHWLVVVAIVVAHPLLAATTAEITQAPGNALSFNGCEDRTRSGGGAHDQPADDPRTVINSARQAPREQTSVISGRVFKSFSLRQIDDQAAASQAKDCWSRLDGVWREENEIRLDRSKDPEGWESSSSLQLSIANGNFTTPSFIVVNPASDPDTSLRVGPAFDPGDTTEYLRADDVALADAMRIRGPVKSYRSRSGELLRVDVTLSGYVRLRLDNKTYLRPKPGVTKAVAETQTPADDAFLVSYTLENMVASRRGYDIVTQDPFFLMQNGKFEVFAQIDRRNYVIEERRIVPMGFTLHKIDAQGTVYRKELSTSEQDTQRSNAHSFGANISGSGEVLGYGIKASAGFSHAQSTGQSMRSSSTVAQAVAISRVKQYALIVDHPYVTLSDSFIDAVEDARRYGDYQSLIQRFGTHYAYATTFGAVGKMTQNYSQSSLEESLSTEQKNRFNASASVTNPIGPSMASDSFYSNTQGNSSGNKSVSESDRTEFVAAGGNGSWNEMGFTAGQTPYPILLDLRPLHELLNPINFPGQPEVYLKVREKLSHAIKRYVEENTGGLSDAPLLARFSQPAAPEPKKQTVRKLIKYISFPGGQIAYYRTYNSPRVRANTIRMCLVNNTGRAKAMMWTRVPANVNNMSAPKRGSKSCASFALHQRVEWIFVDGMFPRKSDAMSFGNDSGTLVEFIWVKD